MIHYIGIQFILIGLTLNAYGYITDPGPKVVPTIGNVWPRPKVQTSKAEFSTLNPTSFTFETTENSCDILAAAFERYGKIIRNLTPSMEVEHTDQQELDKKPNFRGRIEKLQIHLKLPCATYPDGSMDETYTLKIFDSEAVLHATAVWGAIRGLETFSQVVVFHDPNTLIVNNTEIIDEPRFPYRGLLLDTARHFITVDTLQAILDGMSYNKMNVLHWHIIDDHSFPYNSTKFPELSAKGAYSSAHVYNHEDIKIIVDYARLRGIRIIPEFGVPSHTRSIGYSHPELLTPCGRPYTGKLGPLDVTKEEVFAFLQDFYAEIREVFPDKYIHIGGHDVGYECFKSNRDITAYMKKKGIRNYDSLMSKFYKRMIEIVESVNASAMVYQDVFYLSGKMPADTYVSVYKGATKTVANKITGAGNAIVFSSCWNLDGGKGDWKKQYECEPTDFAGGPTRKAMVKGGEAVLYTDNMDSTSISQHIFPKIAAAAERLWSQPPTKIDHDFIKRRLEEHYCRLLKRGVSSLPLNGPGFCLT